MSNSTCTCKISHKSKLYNLSFRSVPFRKIVFPYRETLFCETERNKKFWKISIFSDKERPRLLKMCVWGSMRGEATFPWKIWWHHFQPSGSNSFGDRAYGPFLHTFTQLSRCKNLAINYSYLWHGCTSLKSPLPLKGPTPLKTLRPFEAFKITYKILSLQIHSHLDFNAYGTSIHHKLRALSGPNW